VARDPNDKQLVQDFLSRPRRTRVEMEEAKLASKRPARAGAATAVADPILTEDEDEEEDL